MKWTNQIPTSAGWYWIAYQGESTAKPQYFDGSESITRWIKDDMKMGEPYIFYGPVHFPLPPNPLTFEEVSNA